MKIWILLIGLFLMLSIGMVRNLDRMKRHSEFSIEIHKMCLDQTGEDHIPGEVCGNIALAADAAYSTAASAEQENLLLLFLVLSILGAWIYSVEKSLVKLQNKTDA